MVTMVTMFTVRARRVLLCAPLICACASGNGTDADLADSAAATGDVGEGEAGDDGDEGDAGDDGLGDADGQSDCLVDDFEPNDEAERASVLAWDELQEAGDQHDARVVVDGRLCAAEHDWYAVAIGELAYAPVQLSIDALVAGASWCGSLDGCEGASLSPAPEHTVAVEIYDAAAMVLLTAAVATDGRVDLDLAGPEYGKDLVIHVYSPTRAASFAYELHVGVRDHDAGGPDCEC